MPANSKYFCKVSRKNLLVPGSLRFPLSSKADLASPNKNSLPGKTNAPAPGASRI